MTLEGFARVLDLVSWCLAVQRDEEDRTRRWRLLTYGQLVVPWPFVPIDPV